VANRKDRGQATVEMALVLPLLVVVVAGIVWVGHLFVTQMQLEHLAREGARAAAVEPEVAASAASTAIRRTDASVDIDVVVEAKYVEVRTSRVVEGIPLLGIGGRRLTAEVSMYREDRIVP